MRNILKHILFLACLTAALPIFSQSQPITAKGVYLNKEVSQEPDTDGNYWITLDAFTTGTTVQKEVFTPCDIALVLDISSSMGNSIGTATSFEAMAEHAYSYNGLDDVEYYYKDGDNYYLVQRDVLNASYKYFLYYEKSGSRYYLSTTTNNPSTTKPTGVSESDDVIWSGTLNSKKNGKDNDPVNKDWTYDNYNKTYYYPDGGSRYDVTKLAEAVGGDYVLYYEDNSGVKHYLTSSGVMPTAPTDIHNTTTTIWTGVLYKAKGTTRIDALKAAATAFIETVSEKAKGKDGEFGMVDNKTDDVDHRISIIVFDANGEEVKGLTSVNATSTTELKNTVNGLTLGSGTRPDHGLEYAVSEFSAIDSERESNKVVVLFTDGEPYPATDGREGAVAQSHILKSTYGALVYTVGVFTTPLVVGSDNYNYMTYTSSDYPNAESMTNPGSKRTDGKEFYQYSDGTDLTSIFTSIAEASSSSDSSLGTESMVVIDVMSANFRLPNEVLEDITKIQTYTVDCVGVPADASGSYTFATKDGEEDRVPFTANIVIGKDANDNDKVTISNFDFAANFCGLHENSDKQLVPGGKKLVITFPIETSPQNPGGATLYTNTPESGIYTKDENNQDVAVATFVQPILTLPNIIIRANGLKNIGQSATYTIYRIDTTPIPDGEGGFTYDEYDDTKLLSSQYYTPITVVLTKTTAGVDPIVQIKLNEEGRYMVVESSWTEGYIPKVVSSYAKDEDTRRPKVNDKYPSATNKVSDTKLIRTICKGTESHVGTDPYYVDKGTGTLFVFNHSKKENLITAKFSESAVVNVFKAGSKSSSYISVKDGDGDMTSDSIENEDDEGDDIGGITE